MFPFERGYVISGKYELARLLGRGSMAEVWVAHHRSLGEDVAVKLLALASAANELEDPGTASARFRFEAQIAAHLSRKTRHIVRVTDHGEEGDELAYLVMELLEGHTLEKRLMLSGEMSPIDVSRLVAQVARALECAHAERVVHRDLKPANVFITRDEEGGLLVKLLDFGIARVTRSQRVLSPFSTGQGILFGTPGYMSPEQACGATVDARADLWALATVAYEALTGELPVPGAHAQELQRNLLDRRLVPIHERNPALPAGLARFFARAFAPRVEHRFASASELASSFERAIAARSGTRERTAPVPVLAALQGDAVPMAVDSPPRSTRRSRRRRAAWTWLALGVCAVVLPALVAAEMLETPPFVGVAPASSAEAAPTRGTASALAPAPELASAAEPEPSADELEPPTDSQGSQADRAIRPAPERARPAPAGLAPGPKPSSLPMAPPSAVPVRALPIAPVPRTASDKRAAL